MAFCANCGNNISESAVACPNCGHPGPGAVTTGQATVPHARYAGFWIRFLGVLIDSLIIGVVVRLFGGYRFATDQGPGFRFTVFYNPTSVIVTFLYSWLMLGLNDGRTVGSLATGVRVANPDGSKISIGQAAGREAMAIVSTIPLWLGFFWMLWDSEKRTWHDMVANTRVFRKG